MARVRLKNLTKHFGDVVAVDNVTLDIADREFLTLLGPSGCGKTTLLNMIAGLESPTAGEVWFDDRNVTAVPPERRDIAMVFQTYALYPHMSVFDNVAFGLKMRGVPAEDRKRLVLEAAKTMEIEHLLDRKPRALSGGQRQRVALARAIVRDPGVFPARRTALQPGCAVARGDAHGTEAPSRRPGNDLRLCHHTTRPSRSSSPTGSW